MRDSWSAKHWSPIAAVEARATRERVALYDMTPLMRLEVVGPVSFLQRMTTNNVDRPVGSVVYTLLLDDAGGILSDITVARLAEDRFQIGVNGTLDLHWLRRHASDDVTIRDITGGTCGLGVWGPLARELVAPLTEDIDVSHGGFGYFKVRQGHIGNVAVTMLRVSYVGELGWEIYASADQGLKLWDTLWEAGRELGVIAGGRAAFNSLRLEKGYRLWGTDMTPEDDPYQSGLGFSVRLDKGDFVGRQALLDRGEPERRLTCLVLDDEGCVPMGREPVFAGPSATTPSPTTPSPTTPSPTAPSPAASNSAVPRPTTASPATPSPATPSPATPGPTSPSAGTPGLTEAESVGRGAVGFVTSAAYGHTVGAPIAYAWLPISLAVPGTRLSVGYFDRRLSATVAAEPLFDPKMERIRR